jgi:hypothetical protein
MRVCRAVDALLEVRVQVRLVESGKDVLERAIVRVAEVRDGLRCR